MIRRHIGRIAHVHVDAVFLQHLRPRRRNLRRFGQLERAVFHALARRLVFDGFHEARRYRDGAGMARFVGDVRHGQLRRASVIVLQIVIGVGQRRLGEGPFDFDDAPAFVVFMLVEHVRRIRNGTEAAVGFGRFDDRRIAAAVGHHGSALPCNASAVVERRIYGIGSAVADVVLRIAVHRGARRDEARLIGFARIGRVVGSAVPRRIVGCVVHGAIMACRLVGHLGDHPYRKRRAIRNLGAGGTYRQHQIAVVAERFLSLDGGFARLSVDARVIARRVACDRRIRHTVFVGVALFDQARRDRLVRNARRVLDDFPADDALGLGHREAGVHLLQRQLLAAVRLRRADAERVFHVVAREQGAVGDIVAFAGIRRDARRIGHAVRMGIDRRFGCRLVGGAIAAAACSRILGFIRTRFKRLAMRFIESRGVRIGRGIGQHAIGCAVAAAFGRRHVLFFGGSGIVHVAQVVREHFLLGAVELDRLAAVVRHVHLRTQVRHEDAVLAHDAGIVVIRGMVRVDRLDIGSGQILLDFFILAVAVRVFAERRRGRFVPGGIGREIGRRAVDEHTVVAKRRTLLPPVGSQILAAVERCRIVIVRRMGRLEIERDAVYIRLRILRVFGRAAQRIERIGFARHDIGFQDRRVETQRTFDVEHVFAVAAWLQKALVGKVLQSVHKALALSIQRHRIDLEPIAIGRIPLDVHEFRGKVDVLHAEPRAVAGVMVFLGLKRRARDARRTAVSCILVFFIPEIHFVIDHGRRVVVVLIVEHVSVGRRSVGARDAVSRRERNQIPQVIRLVGRREAISVGMDRGRSHGFVGVGAAVSVSRHGVHRVVFIACRLSFVDIRTAEHVQVAVVDRARTLGFVGLARFGRIIAVARIRGKLDAVVLHEFVLAEGDMQCVHAGRRRLGRRVFAGHVERDEHVARRIGIGGKLVFRERERTRRAGKRHARRIEACRRRKRRLVRGGRLRFERDGFKMVENARVAGEQFHAGGQKAVIAVRLLGAAHRQLVGQDHLVGKRHVARPIVGRTVVDAVVGIDARMVIAAFKRHMGAGETHVETVVAAHHGMLVAVGSVLQHAFGALQHEVAVENDINIGMRRDMALDVIVAIVRVIAGVIPVRPGRILRGTSLLGGREAVCGRADMTAVALLAAYRQRRLHRLLRRVFAAVVFFIKAARHLDRGVRGIGRAILGAEIGSGGLRARIVGILVFIDIERVDDAFGHGRAVYAVHEVVLRVVAQRVTVVERLIVAEIGFERRRARARRLSGLQQVHAEKRRAVRVGFDRVVRIGP